MLKPPPKVSCREPQRTAEQQCLAMAAGVYYSFNNTFTLDCFGVFPPIHGTAGSCPETGPSCR